MTKSQLEKARDILARITDPAQVNQELNDCLGTIVTLCRGPSTHVGIFRRASDPRTITVWEVAYKIGPHPTPISIKFVTHDVGRVSWDTKYDRPALHVFPSLLAYLPGRGISPLGNEA